MKTGWLWPACAALVAFSHPAAADDALALIKNIVVIYAENRSFDHLYGTFPGAKGDVRLAPKKLINGINTRYESTPPAHMIDPIRGPDATLNHARSGLARAEQPPLWLLHSSCRK